MRSLLLLRDLDDARCAELMRDAEALGLDTLVEAHDLEELLRAVALDAPMIGVNARDLSTFEIDRRAQLELLATAPRDRIDRRRIGDRDPRARRSGGARGRERDAGRLHADARRRPRRQARAS